MTCKSYGDYCERPHCPEIGEPYVKHDDAGDIVFLCVKHGKEWEAEG